MEEQIKREPKKPAETELLLAAVLVQDAKIVRHIKFKHDPQSLRLYILYNHRALRWLLYLCLVGNLALAIFEKPAVVPLPYWATMILELLFLICFTVRFIHGAYFQERSLFWKDPKNWTVLCTIIVTVLDMICYCIWVNVAPPAVAAKAVRWSRPLRPLFMVNFPEGRQMRRAFRDIRRAAPEILHVLILFICCMAMFALLALKLFGSRGITFPDGSPYFSNYWDGLWSLYVLVTTANNPDIMMPAYDVNSWYCLFFLAYIIICLYIFISIVLAVIYNKYRVHLKEEVRKLVFLKRNLLGKAFDQLKERHSNRYVVTKETWEALMKLIDPSTSEARINLYYRVLDSNADNMIERNEFLKLADLLNVDFIEVKERPTLLEEKFPRCFMSAPNQFVVKVIKHRFFRYFFDLLILVNAVCIGLSVDFTEWIFLPAFTLEIILKIYAFGPVGFCKQLWNIYDFIIILAAWITTVIQNVTVLAQDVRLTEIILVLRVLRLLRLVVSIDGFKVVIRTIVKIGPSIFTYGIVILMLYYFYAIIGIEIFQGYIKFYGYTNLTEDQKYCGNPKLNGSDFWNFRYCKNNFNNIAYSFVVLSELMVVNQWHILAQGYVLVTNKAARLYFISFHMLCVVILLNIITAFILEVFIIEYILADSGSQSTIEKKIKEMGLSYGQDLKKKSESEHNEMETGSGTAVGADNGELSNRGVNTDQAPRETKPEKLSKFGKLRFSLKKTNAKSTVVLLQDMFEGEIDTVGTDADKESTGRPSTRISHDSHVISMIQSCDF